MSTDCTYCGCDVEAHDPVYVEREAREPEGDRASTEGGDERRRTGQFCNYGCLSAHIEVEGLATGTTCNLDAA